MQAPLKLAALLLALAAVAMPATAAARDSDRGHRGHDRSGHYDRDRRGNHDRDRNDRRAYRHDNRHDRRDRRHDRRIVIRGPRVIHRSPRYYAPRPVVVHRGPPRWSRGHRYYRTGYGRTYVVNDYYNYGLRRPPSGYYWRRSDAGDYLLVAIATGIIADLILNR